ncbi:MAG TPA: energy transducer TonB [Candidatus Polarisedimenticolaceae bacterium]|nr:energy transducer TonB [Candidatus Polarisedimenticolaceae bacterium]
MTSLRSLLRLDDKVAAEGRRISRLGGPPMGRTAPIALLAAVLAHVAILVLPALKTAATLPPSTPAPDFPRVWRFEPIPSGTFVEIAGRSASPAGSRAAASRDAAAEPVPEPAPSLSIADLPLDADAVIPAPDEPPPFPEPGPPPGLAPATPPALLRRASPVFPTAAKAIGASGRVTLRLDVSPDGSVESAAVLECTRPRLGFEASALDAVRQWRYEADPTRTGTRAVVVRIDFRRQDTAP